MRAATSSGLKGRGFTLLEMLVTLAVFTLVSTLLWQALAQLAQVESRLAGGSLLVDREALRRAWVQQALAGTATGAISEPGPPLRGNAASLSLLSTMPPWPSAADLERVTLDLRPGRQTAASGRRDAATTLWARRGDGSASAADGPLEWPLMELSGRARFEYLAQDGQWSEQWPLPLVGAGERPQRLPRAIRVVVEGDTPGIALWVPVTAMQNPMIRRADVYESDRLP